MTDNFNHAEAAGETVDAKLDRCQSLLRNMENVIVAFSAGVDSTYLLAVAVKTLGVEHVIAGIGISPSLAQQELSSARSLVKQIGVELVEFATDELDNPEYAANPAERCYFCKGVLFSKLIELAKTRDFPFVVSGANADDAMDYRPGLRAGEELGIRNPLMDAGLTKAEIRTLSQRMNLPTWDKPAMPCLASRVPYGQVITLERLTRIERAERAIRGLGFSELRVRDHDTVARIEVPVDEFSHLLDVRLQVISELKKCGYTFVSMDLAGFRSGSLNETLQLD